MARKVNLGPTPNNAITYTYGTAAQRHAHAILSITGDGMDAAFEYDNNIAGNGNMTKRTIDGQVYNQAFDAENRLIQVVKGTAYTTFYYDADGNRVLTVLPNGTKVYTPFPEYEESITLGGTTTQRSSYFLAGQLIAVQVKVGTAAGTFYLTLTDHLGNYAA
jgi:YD repeat-containing protein